MADSGLRLVLMLKKIPREPKKITTRELQHYFKDEGYDISLRTLQRDLAMLSEHFPIIATEPDGRGREGAGWAFMHNSPNTGIPSMEPATALTFLMGMEHLQQLLPQQVQQHLTPFREEAETVLKNFNKRNYSAWPDKVRVISGSVLKPASIDTACLNAIYEALLDYRQFSASYNGKAISHINPYGIVQRGNTLYLLCTFFDYTDIRITALHRFSEVQLLNTTIAANKGFNIDNYINSGEMQWPWGKEKNTAITLKLCINNDVRFMLQEAPLTDNQQIKPADSDGWHIVTAKLKDTHELRWWLLSQGDCIEVLAPRAMRQWFGEVSANLSSYYHGHA